MDVEQLRSDLRCFINDEKRYLRFIQSCNFPRRKPGRLRYWQERVWEKFVGANSEYQNYGPSDILDAFYICHVHLKPLRSFIVHIPNNLVVTSSGFNSYGYPFSYKHPLARPESEQTIPFVVDHCVECLKTAAESTGKLIWNNIEVARLDNVIQHDYPWMYANCEIYECDSELLEFMKWFESETNNENGLELEPPFPPQMFESWIFRNGNGIEAEISFPIFDFSNGTVEWR